MPVSYLAPQLLTYIGFITSEIFINVLGALAAWNIAVKEIKLSARIMLAFVRIYVVLVALLAVIVLVKYGFALDYAHSI